MRRDCDPGVVMLPGLGSNDTQSEAKRKRNRLRARELLRGLLRPWRSVPRGGGLASRLRCAAELRRFGTQKLPQA